MMHTPYRIHFLGLVARCLAILAAGAALATLVLYALTSRKLGPSYAEGYAAVAALRSELFEKSAAIYLVAAAFILLGIVIIALLHSHRVAGPVYRMGMAARAVASGDLSGEVRLRGRDAVHPLAEDLNRVVSAYREILLSLEHDLGEIKKDLSDPEKPKEEDFADGLGKKTERLRRTLSQLSL